jgi:creatinine amidohydrolase
MATNDDRPGMTSWGRYAELTPAQLAGIRTRTAVAYVPWGALQWHGPHLPLGLDGLVAETIAERVARRTGGVLLPTTWWPTAPIPHVESLGVRVETLQSLWGDVFAGLHAAEWKIVVTISGHYAPSHELALIAAAEEAMRQHQLLVLAVPTLALVDEEMLDHAGLWETSLLMALRPDLVQLDELGQGPLNLPQAAFVGRDPRGTASASIGASAITLAVDRISAAVTNLLEEGSARPLQALYESRRERHRAFIERYGNQPEAATRAWWADLHEK